MRVLTNSKHDYTTKMLEDDLSLGFTPTNKQALDIMTYILTDARGSADGSKSNFDHIEDFRYIYPSFIQIYDINLKRDRITWWDYTTMLEGCFVQDCILNSVITIRDMDISNLKNEAKESALNAKAKYRLTSVDDKGLGGLFSTLKGASNGS